MTQMKITLDNCDKEPIHTPGFIQPHGVLLAFDYSGHLMYFSANASEVLGGLPSATLVESDFQNIAGAALHILNYLQDANNGDSILLTYELHAANASVFDLVMHAHQEMVIAEFELRNVSDDDISLFSVKVQKALNTIRQQKSVGSVLKSAVKEIRAMTGFDRVMAYIFHHDDSGHIFAEAKREDLDSLVNRHYPASDIPPQARRLYIENTLRLIVDVNATPVALLSKGEMPALDMSHSLLRSVSPIHIEYLQNMGVGASMSISIVVNGRLWGLIACHHMSARQVPYSVRMGCDVLCQILGSTVNQLETKLFADLKVATSLERSQLSLKLLNSEDFVQDLLYSSASFKKIIPCDGILITYNGKVNSVEVSRDMTAAALIWLDEHTQDYFHFSSIQQAPDFFQSFGDCFSGALGFCIDKTNRSWVVYLRKEKVHTISWAGYPEKEYKVGPMGPRLTPRGSFDEWRETVKGQSEPWSESELSISKYLHVDLIKLSNVKNAENERIRTQLMAILGHDLRDPLNSISMATQVLVTKDGASKLSDRIQNSSGRMQRLITDVMDMAKLQGGIGLHVNPVRTNLTHLLNEIVDENRVGYPNVEIFTSLEDIEAMLDPDRISQVISNLISNARHHGLPGTPVHIRLEQTDQHVLLSIRNKGAEIKAEFVGLLFDPFKRLAKHNDRNKSGMGLGLYISKEIMKAHHGDIVYSYDKANEQVIFTLSFFVD